MREQDGRGGRRMERYSCAGEMLIEKATMGLERNLELRKFLRILKNDLSQDS